MPHWVPQHYPDTDVHNSADSSVEPNEVSTSTCEVKVKAGAQHVGCSDKKLGNPEPTPMRMKRAQRSVKSQTTQDVLESSSSSISSTADVESKSTQRTSKIDSKHDAHIPTDDANILPETDHLRKEPIPVKPTNLVKTDSVTSSAANSTPSNSQVCPTPLKSPPIDHGETTAVRAARAARSDKGKRLRMTADMKAKIASHKFEIKDVKATKRAARREPIPSAQRLVTVLDETEDSPMLNGDGPILISPDDRVYQDMIAAINFNMIHDNVPTFSQDSFIGGAASLGDRSEDRWAILNRTGSTEPMSGIEGEPSYSVQEISNDIPMCENSPSFLSAKDVALPQNRCVEPSGSVGGSLRIASGCHRTKIILIERKSIMSTIIRPT